MTDLIVYYSLEGNTAFVAERLKEKLDAHSRRLVPVKPYSDKGLSKFIWGGRSAIMGDKPDLEDYNVDFSRFDRIIFGFPVWASNFTPPLRTFIEENREGLKGKRFAAFACQSGNGAEKALAKLEKCINETAFEQTAIFIDPKAKHTDDIDRQIDEFADALLSKT